MSAGKWRRRAGRVAVWAAAPRESRKVLLRVAKSCVGTTSLRLHAGQVHVVKTSVLYGVPPRLKIWELEIPKINEKMALLLPAIKPIAIKIKGPRAFVQVSQRD